MIERISRAGDYGHTSANNKKAQTRTLRDLDSYFLCDYYPVMSFPTCLNTEASHDLCDKSYKSLEFDMLRRCSSVLGVRGNLICYEVTMLQCLGSERKLDML